MFDSGEPTQPISAQQVHEQNLSGNELFSNNAHGSKAQSDPFAQQDGYVMSNQSAGFSGNPLGGSAFGVQGGENDYTQEELELMAKVQQEQDDLKRMLYVKQNSE